MLELLTQLFAALCGQNPDHTWAPGGVLLPVCQRCAGLYAGAAVAALLHIWARPRLTPRRLELHGAFLLLMVPFGFHWLPQGPLLRGMTGVLFGFGVVTFLWLPLRRFLIVETSTVESRHPLNSRWLLYVAVLLVTVCAVPGLGASGGKIAALLLVALTSAGALTLAALVTAGLALGLAEALRAAYRVALSSADP